MYNMAYGLFGFGTVSCQTLQDEPCPKNNSSSALFAAAWWNPNRAGRNARNVVPHLYMTRDGSASLWIPVTCGCPSMEPFAPAAAWFKVKKRGDVGIAAGKSPAQGNKDGY